MQDTRARSAFWLGVRDGLPFMLVIVPFGLLFGVVATEAGLDLLAVMGFSIGVIAGAAQFTAVSLLADHAPALMAILAALAVNLRMAMYSASLTPYLGDAPLWKRALVAYFLVDQVYTCAIVRFEEKPEWSLAERLAYYAGCITPVCPFWYLMTLVGALLGNAIPESFALDFAVPITFLAMLAPMLRSLPHLVAALVGMVLGLAFMGLPNGLGLIAAAVIAMMAGAETERRMTRRQA